MAKEFRLSEEQKTWIVNNSAKFTSKEIAAYYGVIPQIITSFCKYRKLPLIKRKRRDIKREYKPKGKFFDYDKYIQSVTSI